jgi:ribosomal protein S18 acetylase RimI-like enzyme
VGEIEVRRGVAADVASLEPLWASMVEHHRAVAGDDWPVRTADAAWAIRREQYAGWLADGSGTLLLATTGERLVGYAMLQVQPPGATWDLGESIGELESLAVAPEARGAGIGHRLMDECRAILRDCGVTYWTVGVVEVNEGAVRLYEREGFRPYYRQLLGRV